MEDRVASCNWITIYAAPISTIASLFLLPSARVGCDSVVQSEIGGSEGLKVLLLLLLPVRITATSISYV